ncbi:MAG: 1-deoxy-D-xylulose-5-phosphate synthase [Gammaproteobacteria bacterium]|mgnify:FL=1|jgi:1-deoxy-D-xylulose-5-phosphate synthase|nr:1-deoxy-D-xylulose-5-phosphate synthase [Gammaproteobacteria bacterium]MBT3490229.1 1-deoxy-D-xylulose-5-phosphate synthase [Gammaproteobacteria bacterium]MBT3719822.1 1-deoxy-D-xylulose-5-phosphate synthase [Gammaproteobacteria bacterium]MBT3845670.1 1-deoxy-D-xylulose-5-phosphate synthase [Gammaproteobacteria bacterium]MBT3893109.1 1-deoxy-D-xylulose-5-phosphate synthase [Gammaproteobacteria bacterium]
MDKPTPLTPLLDQTSSPQLLRQLNSSELPELAQQLRDFMIHSVEKTGGHLASSLGVVELSIALHYIYNTPEDRLVWDVGHQCYPHKILTGRKEAMTTLRQQGGISGFTKRGESPYDPFGAGHSSTSISAALGMAIASKQASNNRQTVAVIGDGALTGGMAFEALNHAGESNADLLVVLNDNDMSISENVGGLSRYLGRILTSSTYSQMRETSKKVLSHLPGAWDLARKTEEHMKGMVVPGTLFEELGFNYAGPVDGHDLPALVRALRTLHTLKGPRFLHIITQKGRGYTPAEQDPLKYHGIGRIEPALKVNQQPDSKNTVTYTEIFGEWLCNSVEKYPQLIAITPAMMSGSGMVKFAKQYPDHFIDVGIAEQHAVTLAAGLATENRHPIVAVYSTFLQRGYDQLIHDVALQNLPVLFAIDRAGLVGADGATHTGAFDISFLRIIPNMVVMTPSSGAECQQMLDCALEHPGPAAIRYPRATTPAIAEKLNTIDPIKLGRGVVCRSGESTALLVFGPLLEPALIAAEQINATVVDMRFVAPLDQQLLLQIAQSHQHLITIEENVVAGGAGSGVNEFLLSNQIQCPILNLGLPNHFVEQGERDTLLRLYRLDSDGILDSISRFLSTEQR